MGILILHKKEQTDEIIDHLTRVCWSDDRIAISSDIPQHIDEDTRVIVYSSAIVGDVNPRTIKKRIGPDLFRLLGKSATLAIQHHYSSDYSNVGLDHMIISMSHIRHPYEIFNFFLDTKFIDRKDIKDTDNNFVLTESGQIMLYVASDDNHQALKLLPVLSTNGSTRSNFNVNKFFNSDYCSVKKIRKIGGLFWRINYYSLWGSFYDSLNRH